MNFEAEIEVVLFCFCFAFFCFFVSGHDPCPRRWRHAFWETLLKSAELSRVCVPRVYRDLSIMVTVGHLMTRRRRSTSQESRWRQRVRFLPKSKMINLGGHKRLMGTRNLHLLLLKKNTQQSGFTLDLVSNLTFIFCCGGETLTNVISWNLLLVMKSWGQLASLTRWKHNIFGLGFFFFLFCMSAFLSIYWGRNMALGENGKWKGIILSLTWPIVEH